MSDKLTSQASRFLVVGGLNTLFAYLLFAVLIAFGLHYTIATLLPGIVSIYLGYIANKKIVFKSESRSRFDVILYYLFYFIVYLLNISIQTGLHALGSHVDYVNGAIAIGITVIFSFFVNKFFFFGKTIS